MRRTLTGLVAAAALLSVFALGSPASAAAPASAVPAARVAGTSVSAGTYTGAQVEQIVQNLLNGATAGALTCGLNTVVKKMKALKGRGGLASIAAYSAQISAKEAKLGSMCAFAKQLMLAAAWTAWVGSRYNAVYVSQAVSTSTGWVSKTITYTFDIGPSQSDTRRFVGSVRNLRGA